MLRSEDVSKNMLLRSDDTILRVIDVRNDRVFLIDCIKRTMPEWADLSTVLCLEPCTEEDLWTETDVVIPEMQALTPEQLRLVHERFTMIACVLPFVSDKKERTRMIDRISQEQEVSKQTVRYYLCLYLAFQNVAILAPKFHIEDDTLSQDEKNMRWALNKFFYTRNKNSLNESYTMLIKEKYTDGYGKVLEEHPTFYQFRYFYRKHKKLQTYYISRDGIKSYERNNRPLTGDGIQEYMPYVGMAMLDATVCDIYLVNEAGGLVGRPILTAAIDGFSSLCVGYSLQWEGGIYSVKTLMKSILADKVQWCQERGIRIRQEDWDACMLPAVFITDAGSEYRSETFEQIAELGVTVINLPSYRPELKGGVEKFFDLVQDSFKPYLKGKGVIEPDFQERGVHDYRKDACLTMEEFERIVLHCVIYYNSQRIIENYPYTDEMLQAEVKPYANAIYAWGRNQNSVNLMDVDYLTVMMTLLPRTTGKFSRKGLKVNGMRYHAEGFTEEYLRGGTETVAYNPDNVSEVWLLRDGQYIPFELIESRYRDKSLTEVQDFMGQKKELVKSVAAENLQAKVDLASHIQTIAQLATQNQVTSTRDIRKNRTRERTRTHFDLVKGGVVNVD